jgi:hypothetical protein
MSPISALLPMNLQTGMHVSVLFNCANTAREDVMVNTTKSSLLKIIKIIKADST